MSLFLRFKEQSSRLGPHTGWGLLNVTVSGLFPFGALDNFDPVTNDETL
jgi:hypothetical protein